MGYPQGKGIGTILKMHYERLLYPFEIFCKEKATKAKADAQGDIQIKTEDSKEGKIDVKIELDEKIKAENKGPVNSTLISKKHLGCRRRKVTPESDIKSEVKSPQKDVSWFFSFCSFLNIEKILYFIKKSV